MMESGYKIRNMEKEIIYLGIVYLYFSNGDQYIGDWLQDKMNGKGRFITREGTVYAGEFKNHRYIGPVN